MTERLAFSEPMPDDEREALAKFERMVWSLAGEHTDPQASASVFAAAMAAAATKARVTPRELLENMLANLPDEDPEWRAIAAHNPTRFH